MLRIDFYVQHLVRHNARAIQMTSGQPVRFRFPTGDRRSNQPMDHSQLTRLVQEVADDTTLATLERTGTARFPHEAGGVRVEVTVEVTSPQQWTVELRPEAAEAAAPRRGGAILDQESPSTSPRLGSEPPRSPRSFTPESQPDEVPKVLLQPGEPRINRYLRLMVAHQASDLHLSSRVPPMMRLHGEMRVFDDEEPLEPEEILKLIDAAMPDKNRAEFERDRDTDFAYTIEDLSRFRVNVFEDRLGPGAVFRRIPFEIMDPDALGIPRAVLDLCWLSKGLVVVTGPTGSGKSTTLASLIDYINENRTDHIITIEDPIEFVHSNKRCLVNQREVGSHTAGFKRALRAALREDPDIVLVGEMRDLETIAIAIETAETGHLVFGTLHTTTAPSTVDRIIDQFPPDQQAQIRVMLSESLKGVLAQVLCKKRGGGRVAAFETLISTPAVSNLVREGKTFQLQSVMQTGKNLGMQTMTEHLFRLAKDGVIDAEEAYIKSNDKQMMKEMLRKANIALNLDRAVA